MRRRIALLAIFVALSVLHTWPLAANAAGLSRLDNDDTGLNTWIVAWVAHIVPRAPLTLFDAPIFYPERHTLAYSEHLFVPSLMGAPLLWSGVSPVLVYNLLVLAGFALSGWAMSLVVARWTGSTAGGVMAGMLFAFNAHLLTRLPQLQALHMEFFPIALYAFDLILAHDGGATGRATRMRHAMLLVVAVVLQSLCSNHTMVFLGFTLVVASAVRAPEWLARGRRSRALTLVCCGALVAAAVAPFLWPYYLVSREQGLLRSIDEVRLYSADGFDYLTTAGRFHYEWWSRRFFDGRTALFPGVLATMLAVIGAAGAGRHRDPRIRMVLAMGVAGLALSFGPALPGYAWLHAHVPILQGIRAAARWGVLLLTAVAVLAGYGVAVIERRWSRSAYWPAVVMALAGIVTLEALRAPMGFVPFNGIPAIYDRLAGERDPVLVEFPMYRGPSISDNAQYLVANTRYFGGLVNGYSGFEPPGYAARAERWGGFPSAGVLADMRLAGVTHVMLHLEHLDPAVTASAARESALVLEAEDGERRLYRLVGGQILIFSPASGR